MIQNLFSYYFEIYNNLIHSLTLKHEFELILSVVNLLINTFMLIVINVHFILFRIICSLIMNSTIFLEALK